MRKRGRELGEVGEAFVPLVHDAGVEAEVDWGEAKVVLRGELVDGALVRDARVLLGRRRS